MATATDVDFIEMRIGKVVALKSDDHHIGCIVLDEVSGDRHFLIQVGQAEAFSLAASLQGVPWGRPMTYQFVAALLEGLGGRVRQVRIDRLVAGAYAATVEVEGPLGVEFIDRAVQRRAEPRRAGGPARLRRPRGTAGRPDPLRG
jgi:bifunctional DNase/RNase